MIETFNRNIIAGSSYNIPEVDSGINRPIADRERIIRFFARETRLLRRLLAELLVGLIEKTKPTFRATRVVRPSSPGDPYYCFLVYPNPFGRPHEEYRRVRSNLLVALCYVTKLLAPDALDIIGFATETDISAPRRSEDALYLNARIWDLEMDVCARELQVKHGLLTKPTAHQCKMFEFPIDVETNVQPGPNPRNKPCRVGVDGNTRVPRQVTYAAARRETCRKRCRCYATRCWMPKKPTPNAPIPANVIERWIHTIRDHRVMLDADLAALYQVETSNLNKAVKRNLDRFPEDFMFQLTKAEWDALTFQTGISNAGRGGRRTAPYAFTEQGVAMLSSVLNSHRAVQVNIVIVRTFVKLREIMGTHKELSHKVAALERKYQHHDEELKVVFNAIKKLLAPPTAPPKRRIGFRAETE